MERETELATIGHAISSAIEGQGQFLVVEGPSGIGKTRLLHACLTEAKHKKMTTLWARGAELENGYTFGLVLQLLENHFARASHDELARLLRGRASLASPLLAENDDAGQFLLTDEFSLIHGLYWCVVNMSDREPLAVIVDDIQWADPPSLKFLTYLADRLGDLPVMLAVGMRTKDAAIDVEPFHGLVCIDSALRLRPSELTQDAVHAFLADEYPDRRENSLFTGACWAATGGNPFLLHELIAGLHDDPRIPEGMLEDSFVPESISRRVVMRLKRLGAAEVAVARACAVLGDDVGLVEIAQLANLDYRDASAAAERLALSQFFATSDPATFMHPIVRSAVYKSLPAGSTAVAHEAAARLLHTRGAAAEQVAKHLLLGPPIMEPWVPATLLQGARAAARKGAPAAAIPLLRQALEITDSAEQKAELLVSLGLAEATTGEEASLARFTDALAIADPRNRAEAIYALGETLYRYGRQQDAVNAFRRGLDEFGQDNPTIDVKFEGPFLCAAYYDISLHSEVIPRLRALDIGDNGHATDLAATALWSFNQALTTAPLDSAVAAARIVLDGAILTAGEMGPNIAMASLWLSGRPQEARIAADAVLSKARNYGNALSFAETSMMRAIFNATLGNVQEAIADAQASLEGVDRGWRGTGSAPLSVLASSFIDNGALSDAEEALQAAETALRPDHWILNAWFYVARGRLRLLSSQPGEALADFRAAGDALRPYGIRNPMMARWRTLAGLAAHSVGEHELALDYIDNELSIARDFGLVQSVGTALRARAMVLQDYHAAIATFAESASALARSEAPLELARTLVALGSAQRRHGSRVASREPLREALHLARRCGALALAQRARDELLASGARPRTTAVSGLPALTPSEYRVARLAAAGKSNREIAEELFLTKGTIAWHVKNIYRKLHVDSRSKLSHVMADEA